MRQAAVYFEETFAGILKETENGYWFTYDPDYLASEQACAVSLTLPLREEPYHHATMFGFFDGLIPEGWLLSVARKNWKLDPRDRMGLLLVCCQDCIGAVSVRPVEDR